MSALYFFKNEMTSSFNRDHSEQWQLLQDRTDAESGGAARSVRTKPR